MDKGVYRIIDANLNRTMEGVRVCEDIIRFSFNNERITRRLKKLRHDIFNSIKGLQKKHLKELLSSRNIDDVGKSTIDSERHRENLVDLSRERETVADDDTYYRRSSSKYVLPGILLNELELTL